MVPPSGEIHVAFLVYACSGQEECSYSPFLVSPLPAADSGSIGIVHQGKKRLVHIYMDDVSHTSSGFDPDTNHPRKNGLLGTLSLCMT